MELGDRRGEPRLRRRRRACAVSPRGLGSVTVGSKAGNVVKNEETELNMRVLAPQIEIKLTGTLGTRCRPRSFEETSLSSTPTTFSSVLLAFLGALTYCIYRQYLSNRLNHRDSSHRAQPATTTHRSSDMVDKKMEEAMAQFCGVTGASVKDAQRFLAKYKRVDVAVDAYYSDPQAFASTARTKEPAASTSKITELFEQYKDPDGDEIGPDGTIKLCSDLGVDPEDVVLLAVAYELKAPRLGSWAKTGWVEGWKRLGCDKLPAMQAALMKLRDRLGSEPQYFNKVYAYTFEFSRAEGARSLAADMAKAFWQLLIPHGLQGGAVSHVRRHDDDDDVDMSDEEGWKDEYTQWWFEFLDEKNVKGISKDTWQMFLEFVRTIDSKFEKYDLEAAWPSTIDDFVEYAKERLARS